MFDTLQELKYARYTHLSFLNLYSHFCWLQYVHRNAPPTPTNSYYMWKTSEKELTMGSFVAAGSLVAGLFCFGKLVNLLRDESAENQLEGLPSSAPIR